MIGKPGRLTNREGCDSPVGTRIVRRVLSHVASCVGRDTSLTQGLKRGVALKPSVPPEFWHSCLLEAMRIASVQTELLSPVVMNKLFWSVGALT